MAAIKTILHLTPFFSPNIGGVETHLTDLTTALSTKKYKNIVLTYSPITTPHTSWKKSESPNPHLFIRRFAWIGRNLFHRLEAKPLINFLYLTPYYFFRVFIWLLFHPRPIDTIHSHGLNAALVGIIIKAIFRFPNHILSIYSSYDSVPQSPRLKRLMLFILNHVDHILTQSKISLRQLIQLGASSSKLSIYHHWIDLRRFSPQSQKSAREITHLPPGFTVLFIGRLIPQKGALLLAKVAAKLPRINFVFVGGGPDYFRLKQYSSRFPNIKPVGNVPYHQLHHYYASADLFCLPSLYEEGWGRVILEALGCGIPVVASNLGAVPEVITPSVSFIAKPTVANFSRLISKLYHQPKLYINLQKNCRFYALRHFSIKNLELITRYY
ncbi:MAG: glycosyltransferase family 4 protein [Candidatus Shapirobacteria bacterium]|jgi:glycosyltransferase involved in cell wall biosynthesis